MKKFLFCLLLIPFFSFSPTTSDFDVFFGDSITFGNELGPQQYTARWSTLYCNAVPTNEINESRSGASMAPNPFGRPVFNINDVPAYQPAFRHIFVSYWVNDYLYGTTPAAYATATTTAVNGIIAKGWPAAKIVLCFNFLPESNIEWPYMTHAKAQQWLSALRGVKQAKGTSFLDFYTPIYNRPDKGSYSGDWIHPTLAWNAIMEQYAETSIEGPSSSLPVSIIGFSGQRQGTANALKWTVADEQNISHYEINRSQDGINWTKAGEITSAGNSATQRHYNFTDNNTGTGRQLYRLRAVDKNGTDKLSTIVIISGPKATRLSLESLFPNPVAAKINLVVNAPGKDLLIFEVMDAMGRAVKVQKESIEAGANSVALNVQELRAGAYLIKATSQSSGSMVVERFIKE
ncbi:MAG TPA: GDSL-type esterase/lipase family protein [Flavisolibacter sp.]|jgi:hypothetical protein|nr:GDSL-type esterase/lipase family protein [Flavisolibacter sp.]